MSEDRWVTLKTLWPQIESAGYTWEKEYKDKAFASAQKIDFSLWEIAPVGFVSKDGQCLYLPNSFSMGAWAPFPPNTLVKDKTCLVLRPRGKTALSHEAVNLLVYVYGPDWRKKVDLAKLGLSE